MAMNTEYLSADTTNFSHLSLSGTLKMGALETRSTISGAGITGTTGAFMSTLSANGAVTMQSTAVIKSTLSVIGQTTLGRLSLTTGAGSTITQYTDVPAGCLFVTVGASGLSIGIRSGNSLYWATSTTSGA